MDPKEALCQINSIMYSAFHISCPTRQVTLRDRDPIHVTPAVKLLIEQPNKQLRKQNTAKVKDLNERIRKLVQKNSRFLDKVGSVEATKFEHELRLFPSRILRFYQI